MRRVAVAWLVGLLLTVAAMGILVTDLWRTLGVWQETSAAVETAARAGASGLDETSLRTGSQPRLDPRATRRRAVAHLDGVDDATIHIADDGSRVTVTATQTVDLSVLALIGGIDEHQLRATTTAEPHRQP